MEAMFG
jgi:hypothetical protein